MNALAGHLVLFLAVTVGSAIPFLPTGEMVSSAAALAAHSEADVVVIFLVAWVASVLGDTILLYEARLGAGRLRRWIDRRQFAARVHQAERKLHSNGFSAIVTGRLIPGGRAPVIIALGLGRYPVRRFVAFDAVACAIWAAIYAAIGSIGGRIADHPIWGIVAAIAIALLVSAVVQQLMKLWRWTRVRRLARLGRTVRTADEPV